jgi:hypothetical protein
MADKKSTVARRHTAVMESFFSTVKIELADRFASRSEPKMELSITSRCLTTNAPAFDARPDQSGGERRAAAAYCSSWGAWPTTKNTQRVCLTVTMSRAALQP